MYYAEEYSSEDEEDDELPKLHYSAPLPIHKYTGCMVKNNFVVPTTNRDKYTEICYIVEEKLNVDGISNERVRECVIRVLAEMSGHREIDGLTRS